MTISSKGRPRRSIAIRWHIADVQSRHPELSDDQAWQVLQAVKANHDSTIGVNWETLDWWCDELFG